MASSSYGSSAWLDLYEPTEYAAVRGYIHRHPFLADLLIELHGKAREYFGANTRLALDVVRDPEARDAEELLAVVRSSLPREQARERLRELDESWWLDNLDRARCKLTVDVESS